LSENCRVDADILYSFIPDQKAPVQSTAAELPDWLIKQRKRDAERKRINRHGSPGGKKKGKGSFTRETSNKKM
jgi:hypothetical protein